MFIALVLIYIFITYKGIKKIVKEPKKTKIIIAFLILILIGFGISIIQIKNIAPQFPSNVIEKFVDFLLNR